MATSDTLHGFRRVHVGKGFALRARFPLLLAMTLAACTPPPSADEVDTGAAANPKTAAETKAPIVTEKLPGPVALAPEVTGGAKPAGNSAAPGRLPGATLTGATPPALSPAATPLAKTASVPAAAVKEPPAAPASSPPKPTPAVAAAAAAPDGRPAPFACPAGTVGLWSKDVIGSEIYICKSLHPQ